MSTSSQPNDDGDIAVALQYEAGRDHAPRVVAQGREAVARRIVDLAAENGVPLHRDAGLAGLLNKLEVGMTIPVEVFAVVAEILACIYRAGRAAGGGNPSAIPPPADPNESRDRCPPSD